jgi:toxin YoeB
VKIAFTPIAWEQYLSWASEPKTRKRIERLIAEAMRHPGGGIGQPERLSENLSEFWSRRITQEHRLVYEIEADTINIVQCRYHY